MSVGTTRGVTTHRSGLWSAGALSPWLGAGSGRPLVAGLPLDLRSDRGRPGGARRGDAATPHAHDPETGEQARQEHGRRTHAGIAPHEALALADVHDAHARLLSGSGRRRVVARRAVQRVVLVDDGRRVVARR